MSFLSEKAIEDLTHVEEACPKLEEYISQRLGSRFLPRNESQDRKRIVQAASGEVSAPSLPEIKTHKRELGADYYDPGSHGSSQDPQQIPSFKSAPEAELTRPGSSSLIGLLSRLKSKVASLFN